MKRVRLTALAEFDLAAAQDFYAPNGALVLDHFMENVNAALDSLVDFAGIQMSVKKHFMSVYLSMTNKKARHSVLVRGARLCHTLLKAKHSPLNCMTRRHPS